MCTRRHVIQPEDVVKDKSSHSHSASKICVENNPVRVVGHGCQTHCHDGSYARDKKAYRLHSLHNFRRVFIGILDCSDPGNDFTEGQNYKTVSEKPSGRTN